MSEVGKNLVNHEGEMYKKCLDCGFIVGPWIDYCGHCQIKATERKG